ncbi:DHH family phosphoesterase [Patescibacteria group bacterium]|nr:DHH family phosphoesterase [Patescibacteria group bacterium]
MHFSKVTVKSAQLILDSFQKSKNILLHLHQGPDGDSIGSSLAIYHFLKNTGKKVNLIKGDSQLPQNFSSLPGFSKIIPKNYFQIKPEKFDLFLINDSSSIEQISKLEKIKFPSNLKTIVIDHHASNTGYGNINLVDTSSPATAQIIAELLFKWKAKITPKIAVNLIVGTCTDSGGFKYAPTNHKTFKIISKLTKICPDFHKYIFEIENNARAGQIKYKGLALSSIKTFFDNKVAISAISNKKLKKHNISQHHTHKSGISNILKSVIDWDIGVCVVEVKPKLCNLSMRTRDSKKYDLSKIATAIGGGGHPTAAGAQIKKSLPQAIKFILKTIQSLHPHLGQP